MTHEDLLARETRALVEMLTGDATERDKALADMSYAQLYALEVACRQLAAAIGRRRGTRR